MFGSRLINQLRDQIARAYTDTCDIYDSVGSPRVRTKVGDAIPCRIRSASPHDIPVDAAFSVDNISSYVAELPYNTTIHEKNELVHSGHSYLVVAVVDGQTPNLFIKAMLQRQS